jgi:hypothetical protein
MTVSVFSIGFSLTISWIVFRAVDPRADDRLEDPARIDSEITQFLIWTLRNSAGIVVIVDQIERSELIELLL